MTEPGPNRADRSALIERVHTLVEAQREALDCVREETARWRSTGLDVRTSVCVALADYPAVWERVRSLGAELAAALQELERLDGGPVPGDVLRWALALHREAS